MFSAKFCQRGLPGQRKRALDLNVSLGDVIVTDLCSYDTRYPELLRSTDKPDSKAGQPLTCRTPYTIPFSTGHQHAPFDTKQPSSVRKHAFMVQVKYEPSRVIEYEPKSHRASTAANPASSSPKEADEASSATTIPALTTSPWTIVGEGCAFELVLVQCTCTRRLFKCLFWPLERHAKHCAPGHQESGVSSRFLLDRAAEASATLHNFAEGQSISGPIGSSEEIMDGLDALQQRKRQKNKQQRKKPPWQVNLKIQAPFLIIPSDPTRWVHVLFIPSL